MERLSVAATYVDVDAAAQQLRALAASRLSGEALDGFEIAVIEALTNIVRHGYRESPGHTIDVRADVTGKDVVVELRDTGIAIPEGVFVAPHAQADTIGDIDAEHGRGIALVVQCAKSVYYRSEHNINVLTMTFSGG